MTQFFTYNKDEDKYEEVKNLSRKDIDALAGDSQWLIERLNRERAKFSDYDELKEKAEKLETEKSELESKITNLETSQADFDNKLAEANLNVERQEVIRKFNLSDDLAEFVTGDTKDEMLARAEKLSKNVSTTASIKKTEANEPDESPYRQMARDLLGSSDD